MSGGEQKMALFADDVLIYLEDPNQSLPVLMTSLTEFGRLSGYKINVQKTQALAFNYKPNQSIKQNYLINWDQQWMKYLGIHLTKDLGSLKAVNYDHIIANIKADFSKWTLIPYLGLASRVEVVKMNVLPRLLYIFQNLPIELTNKDFKELDKFISRFLWKGARPRIKYRTLQLPKRKGGLSLPCFKSYYEAAHMKILINLCDPKYAAKWKDIEEKMVPPIQALMCDMKLQTDCQESINPWLWVSLKMWSEIMKKYNLTEQCRFLRWIAYDTDFSPNKIDVTFKMWENGPKMYWEIIKKDNVMTFQQMKDLYGLDNRDFHIYL